MIVHKTFQIHAIQNAVQRMNPCLHLHWRILDRLNRRKQIDFCAKMNIEKNIMKILRVDLLAKLIFTLTSIVLAIETHCRWVGSHPVGLCAQPCSKIIDPSIAFSKS